MPPWGTLYAAQVVSIYQRLVGVDLINSGTIVPDSGTIVPERLPALLRYGRNARDGEGIKSRLTGAENSDPAIVAALYERAGFDPRS